MRNFKIKVYFKKDILIQSEIVLVKNDYNSTELDFEFDIENGKKVFELKKPDGTSFIKDIVDNKIVLVDFDDEGNIIPIINQAGPYKFEIVCYTENSKITTEPGYFKALDEVVNIDEDKLSEDARLPILDSLINEAIEASKESKEQGDYAKEQGDYAKEQAESVINANSQATEIINSFENNVNTYTTSFNENADSRLKSYNQNVEDKVKEYNDNHQAKMSDYNTNVETKLNEYDTNHTNKLKAYNDNDTEKIEAYNSNHDSKLSDYNTNTETKLSEYNSNHEEKMQEYNSNAETKVNEFNNEVDTLKDELNGCYNNQLIGQAEGTSIQVKDSADARIRVLEIDGALEQETTKGINSVDLKNPTRTNLTYGTFSFKNDILEITNTSGIYPSVSYNILDLVKKNIGKSLSFYYESWFVENETNEANVSLLINYNDDTPNYFPVLVNNNGKKTKFDIPDNVDNISVCELRIFSNNTKIDSPSYLKITKPMLYFGTTTDEVEYEKYTGGQPSPSPDYSQEIEVLEAPNLLPYPYTETTKTVNGITFTDNEDDTITLNGTATSDAKFALYGSQNIDNQKSILGEYICGGINNNIRVQVVHRENNNFHVLAISTGNLQKIDLSTYQNGYIEIKVLAGTSCDNVVVKPMLTKTDEIDSYIPYGCIQNKVTNRNLIKNELISKTVNGVTVTVNKNKSISLRGTVGQSFTLYLFKEKQSFLKENAEYTLSHKGILPKGAYFRIQNSNNTDLFYGVGVKDNSSNNSLTFIHNKNLNDKIDCIIWFGSYSVGQEIDFTLYPQLEEGSKETEYIPYQEDTVNIDLQGNFMAKLTDEIKDTLRIENGHAILNKRIDKERLTSNNILSFVDEYKRFSWLNINSSKSIGSEYVKSNFAICKTNTTVNAEYKNTIIPRGRENGGHIIYVWLDNVTNIDEAKEFLDNNEMYVYYILKEPYEIDLGSVKLPKTFKGVSNIFLNANLETNFKVDYVKDTQLVIDDLQSQINNINTLLSTTETSALLLDNLQSDLESEVI